MTRYVIAIGIVLLIALLGLDILLRLNSGNEDIPSRYEPRIIRDEVPSPVLSGSAEERTIQLFEALSPSVVHITTKALRRDRFRMRVLETPQGTGSGFIWSSEGYVVTNFHVIKDASSAEVTLADGSTWEAELIGVEPDKDLAVLKIDAPTEQLSAIALGVSEGLKVGQSVMAIGNPFGLDQTLTTGIISGLGREIESVSRRPITGVIQTDAAINPGNSGGPLLDSAGRLIGINTAIFSPSGAYAGIGFAVPVDTITRMVPQIIEFGAVRHVGLGIQLLEDHIAQRLGISGLVISHVTPNGPAERAKLQPAHADQRGRLVLGDVIVAIDDQEIHTSNDLYRTLDGREAGEKVEIHILRSGESKSVKVTLDVL